MKDCIVITIEELRKWPPDMTVADILDMIDPNKVAAQKAVQDAIIKSLMREIRKSYFGETVSSIGSDR